MKLPKWAHDWRDRFAAYWRLDLELVCKMSQGKGISDDYHDYPDSTYGLPTHFVAHTCARCGKKFVI